MRTKEWRAYRIETRVPFNFESCENENVELRKTMDGLSSRILFLID